MLWDIRHYYELKQKFFSKHSYSGKRRVLFIPLSLLVRKDVCIDLVSRFKISMPLCSFVVQFLLQTGVMPPLVYDFDVGATSLAEDDNEVLTLANDVPFDYVMAQIVGIGKPVTQRKENAYVLFTPTAVALDDEGEQVPAILYLATRTEEIKRQYEDYKKYVKEKVLNKVRTEWKAEKIQCDVSDFAYYVSADNVPSLLIFLCM